MEWSYKISIQTGKFIMTKCNIYWYTNSLRFKFIVVIGLGGLYQLAVGILSIVYTKTMQEPLREYMADNLRSNYTGGFGVGYLERQFDRSVDWVQINVIFFQNPFNKILN